MADVEEIKDDKKEQPASKKGKKKGEDEKPELSDEDIELKANLEMMVERISESDSGLQTTALDSITR
jgi:26S proteasome regulatory subunit N1